MARNTSYIATVEHNIAGIPCQIGVIYYKNVKGSYSSRAMDPDEYYGYLDADYDILDRKGYHAPWLERKLTRKEVDSALEAIVDYLG